MFLCVHFSLWNFSSLLAYGYVFWVLPFVILQDICGGEYCFKLSNYAAISYGGSPEILYVEFLFSLYKCLSSHASKHIVNWSYWNWLPFFCLVTLVAVYTHIHEFVFKSSSETIFLIFCCTLCFPQNKWNYWSGDIVWSTLVPEVLLWCTYIVEQNWRITAFFSTRTRIFAPYSRFWDNYNETYSVELLSECCFI